MNLLSNIINGKKALHDAQLDDITIVLNDDQKHELQCVLFEIYQDILSFCEKKGFTPFLVGGSALGAGRHHGFIPWDDDLDIGMLRKEYDLFLDAFKREYSKKYIVNAPGKQERTINRFAKIIKRDTLFSDLFSVSEKELNGVFIDIFPIENVPDSFFRRNLKGIASDAIAYIASQVSFRENRTRLSIIALKRTGLINYHIRKLVGFLFSFHNASWWFRSFDKVSQWKEPGHLYTIASGRKHYFGEMLSQENVLPPQSAVFMDISVPVFHNVDSYLKRLYGNYLTIPPVEKRESHHITAFKL